MTMTAGAIASSISGSTAEDVLPLTVSSSSSSSSSSSNNHHKTLSSTTSTSQTGMSVSSSSSSSGSASSPPFLLSLRNPFFIWTTKQIRDTFFCLVFSVMGWYGPKHIFFPSEQLINNRPIPFVELQSGEILLDFRYNNPLVNPPTVGGDMLVFTGVWIPIMFVLILQFCRRRHPQLILNCLLTTIGLTEGLTNIAKFYVMRRRPNFYALCAFDTTSKLCKAPFKKIVEAQLSFPSGHSSLSFCTATILALWMYHTVTTLSMSMTTSRYHHHHYHATTSTHKILLMLSCIIPWSWAAFVAMSRIVDFWHHPSDILAGSILGFACATLCFHVFYGHQHRSLSSSFASSSSSTSSSSTTILASGGVSNAFERRASIHE